MAMKNNLLVLMGMAMLALGLGGCAGTGAPLGKQLGVDQFKTLWSGPQPEYYVNEGAYLREAPSRSSQAITLLGRNTRVLELEAEQEGWTKIKVAESGMTGWIASRLLSSSPVGAKPADSPAKAQDKGRAVQEGLPVKEESPSRQAEQKDEATAGAKPGEAGVEKPRAGSEPGPEGEGRGGLLPSLVTPAEAAPSPPATPAKKEKPDGRKGRPEMFEPF